MLACQSTEMAEDNLLTLIPNPVEEGGEPNLFVSQDGAVYLSWIEYLDDTTDVLQFSRWENEGWSAPIPVSKGTDWFVNWADFPSLAAYEGSGQNLAAHWLQMSAEGTYDYDVKIAQSSDGGQNWSDPFVLHRDSIAAEHGFVTLLPLSEDRMFATWLDGRNTKKEGPENAMTLRCAEFDPDGNLYEEAELDSRICDCCQTDATLTSNGPLIVYRDRSESEIRDISIVRKINGQWTAPKTLYEDNWTIAGCPVNGPAADSKGEKLAVAWYSMAENKPQVKVVFSADAGESFRPPVRLDDGNPLGRVDVIFLSDDKILVSWLEKTAEGAEIRAAKVAFEEDQIQEKYTLVQSSDSRKSGFPIIAASKEQVFMAWTDVDSISTTVKTALIKI